jgi:hypothetical protein
VLWHTVGGNEALRIRRLASRRMRRAAQRLGPKLMGSAGHEGSSRAELRNASSRVPPDSMSARPSSPDAHPPNHASRPGGQTRTRTALQPQNPRPPRGPKRRRGAPCGPGGVRRDQPNWRRRNRCGSASLRAVHRPSSRALRAAEHPAEVGGRRARPGSIEARVRR